MSVYWIVKYVFAGKYQVSDGYQYFELVRNTKNKNRAERLVKLLQDKEDKERENEIHQGRTEEVTYLEVEQKDPKYKYIAFLYNKEVSNPKPEFWEKEPKKGWVELNNKDVDYINQFDDVSEEFIKYKNTNKKSSKKYAAVYPLELKKPDIWKIRQYWNTYIYELNNKIIRYWILHNRKEPHPPYHDNYEMGVPFANKNEAEREMKELMKEYPNDDIEILEQKDPNSNYIAILYNEEGEYEGNKFWTQDIEKGWEEINNEDEVPNEYVHAKNNKGLFAATISL